MLVVAKPPWNFIVAMTIFGDSAGACVDAFGQQVVDCPAATAILPIMLEAYGIDISHNVRTQVTPEVVVGYNRLIVIAEPEATPEWLVVNPRIEFWGISNVARQSEAATYEIVRKIEQNVASISTRWGEQYYIIDNYTTMLYIQQYMQ